MACKEWKNDWVAHLYDEMEPDEERALVAHLEACAECAATMSGLRESHLLLQSSAPEVPAAPRVVVLQPRRVWSGPWVFAAGAAFSLILFGLGFVAGPRWVEATRGADDGTTRVAAADAAPAETIPATETETLKDALAAMQARLDRLEQQPDPSTLTAAEFRQELERFERRVNQQRAGDLEQVIRSLAVAEQRTGTWMEQTQDALTLLALRQDPRYSER